MKLNDMQQSVYDALMDNPPVSERDGIIFREVGTPAKAAFWHGVDDYSQMHRRYIRGSAIFGALVAGRDSRNRQHVQQARSKR